MKLFTILFMVCCLVTTQANASTLNVNPKRLIEVIDVVDGSILASAKRLDEMSRTSKEPIYVLLNSPGGGTVPGFSFADAMQAARERGTKVVCVSGVLAASMAFNLLAYCDERYALAHTKLLFHPVRINAQGGLTVPEMEVLGPQMKRLEAANRAELIKMMGVDQDWFDLHYRAETLWEAQDLVSQTNNDWLTIVDDIAGVDNLFVIEKPKSIFNFLVPGVKGSRVPLRPTPHYRDTH